MWHKNTRYFTLCFHDILSTAWNKTTKPANHKGNCGRKLPVIPRHVKLLFIYTENGCKQFLLCVLSNLYMFSEWCQIIIHIWIYDKDLSTMINTKTRFICSSTGKKPVDTSYGRKPMYLISKLIITFHFMCKGENLPPYKYK